MDRPITISDLGDNASDIMRAVEAGGSFVVTSHGRPVAKIVPAAATPAFDLLRDQAERWTELGEWLDQRPFRTIAPWTRDELYD